MAEEKIAEKIIVRKVNASREQLLSYKANQWGMQPGLVIETGPTPLANQPSPYIKTTYDENKIGAIKKLKVKGVHNSQDIFFYFEWESPTPNLKIEDINTFPDAVAVLIPFKNADDTPIKEMGTKDYPTNSWYWRPDFDEKPKNQVSHGVSTSLYTPESSLVSVSKWENGVWKVVICRPLAVKEEAVNLKPGQQSSVGFAVWEGSEGERGGIKAFSKEWRDLVMEA
jgi:steroid C-25 hydroxylase gamma subunit